MPLTRWERKSRLRHGVQKSIAKRCRCSESHVSKVLSDLTRDRVVEKEIARRMKLPVEEVFGPMPSTASAEEAVSLTA
jgi:hypothetical protein